MFYPPKWLRVVQLFLLPFYCGLRRVFDNFNLQSDIRLKKPDILSPEGTPKGEPKVVQLFLLPLYCVLRGYLALSIYWRKSAQKNMIMFYLMLWYGMGWDGTGYQKCPSMVILCGYIEHVYIYIYYYIHIFKNCRQHSFGFQNLMSNWGWSNTIFELTIFTWVFKNFVPKVAIFLTEFSHKKNLWMIFQKFQKPDLDFKIGC